MLSKKVFVLVIIGLLITYGIISLIIQEYFVAILSIFIGLQLLPLYKVVVWFSALEDDYFRALDYINELKEKLKKLEELVSSLEENEIENLDGNIRYFKSIG